MSTRSNIIVDDGKKRIQIYRHWDGHPENVIDDLMIALEYAWPLPRFEADDFAAAIIRAWKNKEGGNIYIDGSPEKWELIHGDVDYIYVVKPPIEKLPIVEVFDRIPSSTDDPVPLFVVEIDQYSKHENSMEKQQKFEVINVYPGAVSEKLYITVQLEGGDEIEFTRFSYEEYGNVIEYNTEIEDKEQQVIFDELDDDMKDEIIDYLQQVDINSC
jgi:hypothetical protein